MEQQNPTNTEQIISYLARKTEYYKNILELTRKQADILKSGNTDELNPIITTKEKYVKDIKRLDELNIKIQDEMISNRQNLILDKRFNSHLEQLQSIITELMHYEQDCMSVLSSSIDETRAKINNLNKRRRSQQSMRNYENRPARLVDVLH